ncbi:MAG: hypothetical protein ABR609_01430 [Acidimicrobiia bacterium]
MRHRMANLLLGGVVLLASVGVDLGGVFGRAAASASQISGNQIELRLSVQAETGEAVIAHLIEPGGDPAAYPLPETSDGEYLIIVEVRKLNFIVVFELLGEETQSQPLLLTDLGVAPAVLGILGSLPEPPPSNPNSWGWAGLGFGALSLLALAIWAMPAAKNAKTQPDNTLQ